MINFENHVSSNQGTFVVNPVRKLKTVSEYTI